MEDSEETFVLGKSSLTISIVTYHTPAALLESLWSTIAGAMNRVSAANISCELILILVDNSDPPDPEIDAFRERHSAANVRVLRGNGNIGFGAAHNLALREVGSDFHLVLNPDVKLAPDALLEALRFMSANPTCGLLAPAVYDADGEQQFLCKRYPAVLDFLLRGFAPRWLKYLFRRRLERYELRDEVGETVLWDPPVVSGSFMFFRTAILKRLGGFDPRFFLYLEDFDLTLRAAQITRVAYVPQVRITHYGGNAARKGLRHVKMFATAAFRFYNKNGWKWV
jgi:GT2 family glycosyltransferase